MNSEGTTSVTNREALRLRAPCKTEWNSVFEYIDRALQLKDAITKFSEDDIEMNGWIDRKGDENTPDGETGRIGKNMVHTTHPHFFLFP